jgi:hypothetical protein
VPARRLLVFTVAVVPVSALVKVAAGVELPLRVNANCTLPDAVFVELVASETVAVQLSG